MEDIVPQRRHVHPVRPQFAADHRRWSLFRGRPALGPRSSCARPPRCSPHARSLRASRRAGCRCQAACPDRARPTRPHIAWHPENLTIRGLTPATGRP